MRPLFKQATVLVTVAALLFATTGCSSSTIPAGSSPTSETMATLEVMEIFYARASTAESEFEHFKLQKQLLFVECGTIHRGRYRVEEQDVSAIPEESVAALQIQAFPLFQTLTTNSRPTLDEPGEASSFFDPGRFSLNMNFGGITGQMKTSVDALTSPLSKSASMAKKLVETIRAEARAHSRMKSLCGNEEFYGLR